MKKTIQYIRVNPSGNITGLILTPTTLGDRPFVGTALLEQGDLTLEQVGYLSFDASGKPVRMDMMGDEFCGNATRAFGLMVAKGFSKADLEKSEEDQAHLKEGGEDANLEVEVEVSGPKHPLVVQVNPAQMVASVELAPAIAETMVTIRDKMYRVVVLEGITHLIVTQEEEDEDFVREALAYLQNHFISGAYGVIFFDPASCSLVPYVYVLEPHTLYREGSCASGAMALGTALTETLGILEEPLLLHQPRGDLLLWGRMDDQGKLWCSIGGPISYGPIQTITLDVPGRA